MITDIVRPKTVAEAVRAKSAPGAAWLGGGTWLNSGRAPGITTLVSLENLGLDAIRVDARRCRIGAAVTFQSMVDSPLVPRVLHAAARLTASRTLRNMVTVGGELGLRPDDSALIPALAVLGAEVEIADGISLPILEFVDAGSGGLVLGVSVLVGLFAAVRAVSRTSHSPRSLVAAVSARAANPDPRGTNAAGIAAAVAASPVLTAPVIVLSDCRGSLVRREGAETGFDGAALPGRERIEEAARAAFSPRPDLHATVNYKRYMAGVLVADLLAGLAAEAGT